MELLHKIASNPVQIADAIALLLFLRLIHLIISRLVLSPIAKFPGPKLAGLTFWYEFYYDVVKKGRYTWKIKELHEIYGPIVRINPYELHVDDPSFYYKLYTGTMERRDKWGWAMKMFGMKGATFSTVPHDLHRKRRAALNPSFSKAAITRLEPEIRALTHQLCRRLKEYQESGEPANLNIIFVALTTDVITGYCFGKKYGCLDAPDFSPELYRAIQANLQMSATAKQFGWLIPLSRSLPHWIVKATNPLMMRMVDLNDYVIEQVVHVMETDESKDGPKRATVFSSILDSELDLSEKSVSRLMDDGLSVVGAGVATTADTLHVTVFHILNRTNVLKRLQSELKAAIPDPIDSPPLRVLEQLPYLTAVINEGYRMACAICSRLQRVSPYASLYYNEWTIPPGTPVSMTIYLLHNRPDIFPEPQEFRPERWLGDETKKPTGERLDRYLVHFSKGTRNCVGMNLANAEIHFVLAYLFRRFKLELYDTTYENDVDIRHDFLVGCPKLDSKGVRVLVKDELS